MNASSETITGRLAGLTLITFLILVPLISIVAHLFLGGSEVAPFFHLRVLIPEIFFSVMVLNDRRIGLPRLDDISSPLRLLALFWLVWSTCAVALSGVVAVAIVRQVEWIAHGLFAFTLCGFLAGHPEWREKLLQYVAAGFLLYATFNSVILGLIAQPDYPWVNGMLGIGNVRHFGYYAATALVAAHLPLMKSDKPIWRDPANGLVLVILWGFLCWSGSRGSILAVLGALAVMTFFKVMPNARQVWASTITAGVVGGVLSIPFTPPNASFGLLRMVWKATDSGTANEFSAGRITVWTDALLRLFHHPWFGIGPDQFAVAGDKPLYWISHPHDIILQAGLAWGIPGALAFFAGLAYLLVKGLGFARKSMAGCDLIAVWLLLMLSAHALIDGTLYHRFSLIFFAMGAALILSPAIQNQTDGSKAVRTAAWGFTGLATVGTVLIAASFWAFFSAGVPAPKSTRATFARAFPAPLAIIEGGQILDRWAAEWHRSGHVQAATDLALWTEKHGSTPWTTMALMADWMIGDGNEKAGYALRQQAALSEPEGWKAPSLSFVNSADGDAR